MRNFTQCNKYREISPGGNLINGTTNWTIAGNLTHKIVIPEEEVNCDPKRTVILPIKYRNADDAMGICNSLAGSGEYLSIDTFEDWVDFYHLYKNNSAIQKYCDHDGRYRFWLPYEVNVVDKNKKDEIRRNNVTYYKSTITYNMTEAWRSGYPNKKGRQCVYARLGYEVSNCWQNWKCGPHSWDSAPCSACSLAATVQKNTEFKLRGLCERSEFDLEYTLMNDKVTGMPTYIGDKHTIISYDETLNQWNMTVVNNPNIGGLCYSDLSRYHIDVC